MSRLQFFRHLLSFLVRVLCLVNDSLLVLCRLVFTEIAIIVTLHLQVEYDGFRVLSARNQHLVEQIDHLIAVLGQLLFNLRSVLDDKWQEFIAL